ncbi:hypothetical protein CQ010_01250 [Arthrobacter sp. MYb211]|uniref:hypothetical protein n=1 Tax=unclassified Arthrobacter TaxID=235627 RepID=UPI000CFDDC89|nr:MULTISPECIES: hypothetical protein [unclassified Arthrobacter]PRA13300.1 hypothetical protein CQ015_03505 [Arthrobacter sp. MYb221]PRC10497.1 hypothetical protein CQ010_01250 [Arthrobacter sp. MYb211]
MNEDKLQIVITQKVLDKATALYRKAYTSEYLDLLAGSCPLPVVNVITRYEWAEVKIASCCLGVALGIDFDQRKLAEQHKTYITVAKLIVKNRDAERATELDQQ